MATQKAELIEKCVLVSIMKLDENFLINLNGKNFHFSLFILKIKFMIYIITLIYMTKPLEKLYICSLDRVQKFIRIHLCVIYPCLTFGEQQE